MCNQCKVTFFKFRHFVLFYIAVLCMVGFGFSYGFVKIAGMGGSTYDAFLATNCDTSFMFILALITAWFLGSDFSNRTIHHEITLGYSRWSVLLVRELPVLLSGVILHFAYVFSAVLGVACKNGFSGAVFETADILWCITIMLQLMGLQSVITMITFICAKAPAAIAISVSFTIIACNVLRNFLGGTFFTKTVFYLARDNASATLLPTSIVAVITLIGFIALTYMVFRRKEIK